MRNRSETVALLLGLLFVACSSDNTASVGAAGGGSSAGNASTGGVEASGGSGTGSNAGAGAAGATGVAQDCPIWPREKLFPRVGPQFFGPDPGPCKVTLGADVFLQTYDSTGNLTQEQLEGDTTRSTTYQYDEGLLVSGTGTTSFAYRYGTSSAGYSVSNGSRVLSDFDYSLDERGYPVEITNLVASASTTAPTRYVYQYEGCRFVERIAYASDDTPLPQYSIEFVYDDAGHITEQRSPSGDTLFDYSCW